MERLCCMCGDVGFSDKLFRCRYCRNRFQHSYCSNYYSEFAEPTEICEWCRSDDRKPPSVAIRGGSSSIYVTNRQEYSSSGGIKHKINSRHDQVDKSVAGAGSGEPSPRTATRRYKLLKDVMR